MINFFDIVYLLKYVEILLFKRASFLMKGNSWNWLVKNDEFLIAILSTKIKKMLKGELYILIFCKKVPYHNEKKLFILKSWSSK